MVDRKSGKRRIVSGIVGASSTGRTIPLCPLERSLRDSRVLYTYRTPFGIYEKDDPQLRRGPLIRRANKKSWHRHNEKLVMRDYCCEAVRTIGPYRVKPCKQWCLWPRRFDSPPGVFSLNVNYIPFPSVYIKHAPGCIRIVGADR